MCNLLFDSSHDWYTKEEYNRDGNLIYKPPPLDKVWLSEPVPREPCDALEQQHRCHGNLEPQCVITSQQELDSSNGKSSPDFPVGEPPDDSSMDSDPLACGDPGSKGDDDDKCKLDHPSLDDSTKQSPSEEVPPALNISSEGATSEGATSSEGATPSEAATSDFGRDLNGHSYHLKNKPHPEYCCTLGDKQIPVTVRNELRKKKWHQWKMGFCQRKGDSMLHAQSLNASIKHSMQDSSDNLPSI